jgi:hypothetical protein
MHLQQNSRKKNAAFFYTLVLPAVKTTQTARPLKRRIKGDEISSELIKSEALHSQLGASLSKRNK